jgi:hypothetical protein
VAQICRVTVAFVVDLEEVQALTTVRKPEGVLIGSVALVRADVCYLTYAIADVPLFLFHLLEFMDVDYVVDVEEINERWLELAAIDVWAQLIERRHTWGRRRWLSR